MKIFTTLIGMVLFFTATFVHAQSAKSIETLGEFARCNAMATVYIRNGGELTERNRQFFGSAPSDFDSNMKATFAQINECRASNPGDGNLHKKCAESLSKTRKVMYDSFVKGDQMMAEAYTMQDKAKIGTYMMACSK